LFLGGVVGVGLGLFVGVGVGIIVQDTCEKKEVVFFPSKK
jgi:hypothetical protein